MLFSQALWLKAYAYPESALLVPLSFAMGRKQKSLAEFGSVQPHKSGWRACAYVDGKLSCGPTRTQKAEAYADLESARATATSKEEMTILLTNDARANSGIDGDQTVDGISLSFSDPEP